MISGGCRGIDASGEYWAEFHNIPVKRVVADWDTHGRAAGPYRNGIMTKYADALLVIHNDSKGSLDIKRQMLDAGKPVYEVLLQYYPGSPK